MIESVTIQGFQSHVDSHLELSPGFNVVSGSGNSGKSAILRALYRLLRNGFKGTSHIHTGMKECHLQATLASGIILERTTSKSSDVYRVDDSEYTKFGQTFPIEIVNALPISPVQDFNGVGVDFNFRMQHDPLFMLQATPSLRSKIVSRGLLDIDLLDFSVQELNRQLLNNRQDHARVEKEIEESNTVIETLSKRTVYLDTVKRLEEEYESTVVESNRLNALDRLIVALLDVKSISASLTARLQVLETVPNLETATAPLKMECEELSRLESLLLQKQKTREELVAVSAKIDALDYDWGSYQNSLIELAENTRLLNRLEELARDCVTTSSSLVQAKKMKSATDTEISVKDDLLRELIADLSKCPMCERDLTPPDKETVLLNYHNKQKALT